MTPPHSKPTEAETRPFPYRVIDTHSLKFTEDLDDYGWKGGYATLSHTWIYKEEGGEFYPVEIIYKEAKILFGEQKKETQEMVKTLEMGKKLPPNTGSGTSKLLNAIHAAKNMGYRFLWVDSCCINKEDKSEEGISIPSMGDWYMNADICLVFLEDLALSKQDVSRLHMPTVDWTKPMPPLRWATRGWTLQEIVLSQRAVFFNGNWEQVFDFDRKKPPSLEFLETARILYKLCRVPEILICNGAKPNVPSYTILDLAATRNTTIPEDRAYSLMGLFSVKISPVNGEGFGVALTRLCDHLLRETLDETIFSFIRERNAKLSSGISREFYFYPIDRLVFPRRVWDMIKQLPLVSLQRGLSSVVSAKCRLVWKHGIAIDLNISCQMGSLLSLFGGKAEWVLLRSKEKGLSAFDRWQLAEITQETHPDINDGTLEIFAKAISFSPYLPEFSDAGKFPPFEITGSSVYLRLKADDNLTSAWIERNFLLPGSEIVNARQLLIPVSPPSRTVGSASARFLGYGGG